MKEAKEKQESNFLINGTILFLFAFYSQIGLRIAVIGLIRLQFLIGMCLLATIFYKTFSNEIEIPKNKLNRYALFFFSFLFLTIPFAFVKGFALNTLIAYMKLCTVYLMIIVSIDDEKKLKKFIWCYVLMVSLIFLEPFSWAIRGQGFRWNSGAMRLFGYGLWGHPNSLGGVTASHLPFLYMLCLYEKSRIKKGVCIGLMLIAIGTIYFANSRTAFVGLVAFGLFMWWSTKKKLLATVLIIICAFAAWHFAPEDTKARFLTIGKASKAITAEEDIDDSDSIYARIRFIRHGFHMFTENPIIGVGIGNFVNIHGRRYDIWLPAHNLYAQLLCELGLIGTIIFCLIIYQIIHNLRQVQIKIKSMEAENSLLDCVSKGAYYFLLVRLVLGMFGDDLGENYWWICGGLSVVLLNLSERRVSETMSRLRD